MAGKSGLATGAEIRRKVNKGLSNIKKQFKGVKLAKIPKR